MKRLYRWIIPDKMWRNFRLDNFIPVSHYSDNSKWQWVIHPFEYEVYHAREATEEYRPSGMGRASKRTKM